MIVKKTIIFLFLMIPFFCFSAQEQIAEQVENKVLSNIEFKKGSLEEDYKRVTKTVLILMFIFLFMLVFLYFFKPDWLKKKHIDNSKGRVRVIENKKILNNLNVYLLDVDKTSVLLIENGKSISTQTLKPPPGE